MGLGSVMVWVREVGLRLDLIGGGIQGETEAPGEIPGQMGAQHLPPGRETWQQHELRNDPQEQQLQQG